MTLDAVEISPARVYATEEQGKVTTRGAALAKAGPQISTCCGGTDTVDDTQSARVHAPQHSASTPSHPSGGGSLIAFPGGGRHSIAAEIADATPELLAFALLAQFVADPDFAQSSRDTFRGCCTYVLDLAERDA